MFVLVAVLLLQVSRVAIAAYCQNKTGTVVHFSHHSAEHVPSADIKYAWRASSLSSDCRAVSPT